MGGRTPCELLRILYLPVVRYSPVMASNPHLNGNRSLDVLYLDNTYCDTSCIFPTRVSSEALALALAS